MVLSIPESVTLASLPVESFFYGIFVLLFCLSTALFLYRHRRQNQLKLEGGTGPAIRPVLVLSVLIFFTITGHWILAWLCYFSSVSQTLGHATGMRASCETLKSIFVVLSVLLADTAFIYRLWTVWGNDNRVIIIPCLTLTALLVTGSNIIMAHITMDLSKPESQKVFDSWMLADIVFTICTNIYCTTFMSWKIWKVTKKAQLSNTGFTLQCVLSTIVESAAFYTSWMSAAFGLNLAKSPVETLFIGANSAVAGIAFMLINVRVGLGWAATQNRSWRDDMQQSQFKTTKGELRFVLKSELTPGSSMLDDILVVGRASTVTDVEKPLTI